MPQGQPHHDWRVTDPAPSTNPPAAPPGAVSQQQFNDLLFQVQQLQADRERDRTEIQLLKNGVAELENMCKELENMRKELETTKALLEQERQARTTTEQRCTTAEQQRDAALARVRLLEQEGQNLRDQLQRLQAQAPFTPLTEVCRLRDVSQAR